MNHWMSALSRFMFEEFSFPQKNEDFLALFAFLFTSPCLDIITVSCRKLIRKVSSAFVLVVL